MGGLPEVSLDGVTAHELATQLGTVADVEAWRRLLRPRRVGAAGCSGDRRARPQMNDALPVSARGLFKRYGELVAVDHVDLTVEKGDVFGYLGPNGAGKTTSLRMLLGLIRPTEGSIRALRPRSAGGRREGPARRRRLRRRADVLPLPDGGVAICGCSPTTTTAIPARGSRRCSTWSSCADRGDDRSAATRTGCDNGSGSLRPSCASRSCSCSTSRPRASTRPGCATCATSSVGWPARGSPCCSRAISWPRSRSSATGSRSSARARSSTKERLTSSSQPPRAVPPALDPARAREGAPPQPAGIGEVDLVDGSQLGSRPTRTPLPRSRSRSARLGSPSRRWCPRRRVSRSSSSAHRGRAATTDRDGGCRVIAAVARVYAWEIAQAARPEAHVPRTDIGDARPGRLRRRARNPDRRADRRAARPLHPRHGARRSLRRALLHVDLGPAADHRARCRRHRRRRDPERHTEDDPHPLARARPGVRRQGARRFSRTRSWSSSRWGWSGWRRGRSPGASIR